MNIKKENVCRLCFKLVETECEVIDVSVKLMFNVLLLQMNLDGIRNPVMCYECMEITKKSFYFKSDCVKTEHLILSFVIDKNNAEFELEEIFGDNKSVDTVIQDHSFCRFCMNSIDKKKCISIPTSQVNFMEILTVFISELDFGIIKNPVACMPCKKKLESYLRLLNNYLKVEKNINENNKIGPAFLEDLLGSIRVPEIKPELDVSEENGDVHLEARYELIKYEEPIDIKDEVVGDTPEKVMRKYDEYFYNDFNAQIDKPAAEYDTLTPKYISELKMYKCPSCAFETMYIGNLKSHMLNHSDIFTIQVYKCSLCTYETVHKYALKKHVKIHKDVSEVKLYKCPDCPYETRHGCNIGKHMLIHKDVPETELNKCKLCSYRTKHKDYLQKHMVHHKKAADVRKYMCALCNYETTHKDNLKKHTLTHKSLSEVQTFDCTICTFKTARRYTLKKHMQIHKDASEVQVYKCADCIFETKYKYNLTKHMLKHQEVEMLKCGMCDYETKRKDYLKAHTRKHEVKLKLKSEK